jgi:hypothetical protein
MSSRQSPRRRSDSRRAVAVAVLTGILSGGLFGPAFAELVKDQPQPPATTCFDLFQKYYNAAHSTPEQQKSILGADGRIGYLATDPQAQACNITPEVVR